ncbi:TetR/AcrR family transcriptional regulator [Aeromonas bivalvium]|uniref:TetR/AcrR family transcriptional regulator n=1 Tax=Aeromonas bivalvium TaxID=440079 RepID=UPI003D1B66CF
MARKTAFDPAEKLEQAMTLFWQKGYEATSIQDLVDALGINRFSLYNSFGDKQALFQLALDHYLEQVSRKRMAPLLCDKGGLAALYGWLDALALRLSQADNPGCFLQNTQLGGAMDQPRVRERILDMHRELQQALAHACQVAMREGDLAPKTDVEALARFLFVHVQGWVLLGKGGGHDDTLRADMTTLRQQLALWQRHPITGERER